MTKKEAMYLLNNLRSVAEGKEDEAIDMAIEALQFAEHFDLLKEFQSLQEVVHCEDCKYLNRKEAYGDKWKECTHYPQHYTKLNDFCSHGERKEL